MADLKRRLDRAAAGLGRSCAIPRGPKDDGRRACITPASVVLPPAGNGARRPSPAEALSSRRFKSAIITPSVYLL